MKSFRSFLSLRTAVLMIPLVFFSSCYIYSKRDPALLKNADISETIKVARNEMKKDSEGQSLGLWVMRDQVVTPRQASEIADIYLSNIDCMKSPFNIWHASWAISNLYRLGDKQVKAELETAYQKAKKQPQRLEGTVRSAAESHINGEKIVTGFIHIGGLYYAQDHLVVPGNYKYIQSYEEYLVREKE